MSARALVSILGERVLKLSVQRTRLGVEVAHVTLPQPTQTPLKTTVAVPVPDRVGLCFGQRLRVAVNCQNRRSVRSRPRAFVLLLKKMRLMTFGMS